MDYRTLLQQAQKAGLQVTVKGSRLIVRGPESAESLAKRLLNHKDQIARLLRKEQWPPRWRSAGTLSPGDQVKWHSPRFGVRQGRVVLSHHPGWCVVQTIAGSGNLVWVAKTSIFKLETGP